MVVDSRIAKSSLFYFFDDDEKKVADILLEIPSLIHKENLTHKLQRGAKRSREAIHTNNGVAAVDMAANTEISDMEIQSLTPKRKLPRKTVFIFSCHVEFIYNCQKYHGNKKD